MEEKCGNCKFYQVDDSEGRRQGFGKNSATCCRFPPVYAVDEDHEGFGVSHPCSWWQPNVIAEAWCGEFKPYA